MSELGTLPAPTSTFQSRRGNHVSIRPASQDDRAALCEMITELSPRTVALRYFTPQRKLSREAALLEVERLLRDNHNQFVYVAVTQDGDESQIIAIAELVRDQAEPDVAEGAVVVADAFQGEGIGGAIANSLFSVANHHDIERIRAIIQVQNYTLRRMLERLGRPIISRYWQGEIWVEIH